LLLCVLWGALLLLNIHSALKLPKNKTANALSVVLLGHDHAVDDMDNAVVSHDVRSGNSRFVDHAFAKHGADLGSHARAPSIFAGASPAEFERLFSFFSRAMARQVHQFAAQRKAIWCEVSQQVVWAS
jgi:hypothetical protein